MSWKEKTPAVGLRLHSEKGKLAAANWVRRDPEQKGRTSAGDVVVFSSRHSCSSLSITDFTLLELLKQLYLGLVMVGWWKVIPLDSAFPKVLQRFTVGTGGFHGSLRSHLLSTQT